mmetsp:Transcript_17575/g.34420  ORF Transcript_17575/g.34420 Transcript_17575/m.34420 type:complete len:230 (-) Transcript_17575:904-1593(-)
MALQLHRLLSVLLSLTLVITVTCQRWQCVTDSDCDYAECSNGKPPSSNEWRCEPNPNNAEEKNCFRWGAGYYCPLPPDCPAGSWSKNGKVKPLNCTECTVPCDNPFYESTQCSRYQNRECSVDPLHAPWLGDPVSQAFAGHTECSETRSWEEIVTEAHSTPDKRDRYTSGGLGTFSIPHHFKIWVCWRNHPCLGAVGAAAGDRMCYVKDMATEEWHPWGLGSVLQLCGH